MEQDNQPSSSNKKILATVVALVVVVLIVFGISVFKKKPTQAATSDSTSTTNAASTLAANTSTPASNADTATPVTTPAATTSAYKDGTYTATGSYSSPGGQESINVSITLKGDTITDSTVKSGANDDEAKSYQDAFISGYKSLITGKNISSVKLSRVSGSSLTSQGFNNALIQIENKAKA